MRLRGLLVVVVAVLLLLGSGSCDISSACVTSTYRLMLTKKTAAGTSSIAIEIGDANRTTFLIVRLSALFVAYVLTVNQQYIGYEDKQDTEKSEYRL